MSVTATAIHSHTYDGSKEFTFAYGAAENWGSGDEAAVARCRVQWPVPTDPNYYYIRFDEYVPRPWSFERDYTSGVPWAMSYFICRDWSSR